jgi:catechol 2,3-dioxygenase-like lactoylglutathione lyase family enzyme
MTTTRQEEMRFMSTITRLGSVMVPVSNQDDAISFYTDRLGFSLAADVPFGDGDRWVEVAPPAGGAALALVPSREGYEHGRMTGIALEANDVRAVHEQLQSRGVNVDTQLMGSDGTVPSMFFFRDGDGNTLLIVEGAG